jgi:hypothetical protein
MNLGIEVRAKKISKVIILSLIGERNKLTKSVVGRLTWK